MGHSYTDIGKFGDFSVTYTNPSGSNIAFVITDTCNKVKFDPKLQRAILGDAIDQYITSERADLDANGDADVKGSDDWPGSGDGFKNVTWDFGEGKGTLALTATTNLSTSGTITVEIPYADVV